MITPPPRQRLQDWESRLHDVELRHASGWWEWGRFDCARLFADAVEAVTGRDPLAEFGTWASEREAAEVLVRSGYRSVRDLVIDRFRPIDPAAARRGDIGYPAGVTDHLSSPAIIIGPVAFSWRPEGRVVFSRDLIVEAFAV